jgi:hypothetical protein
VNTPTLAVEIFCSHSGIPDHSTLQARDAVGIPGILGKVKVTL